LPLLVVPSAVPAADTSRATYAASGKVLLVDDEETVLQLEEEILVARGSAVRLARNEHEAIDILKQDSVDAVVATVKLPGETSPGGLYRWIEANRSDLAARVVFTTSNTSEDQIPEAVRQSGCQILTKPFQIDEFCKAVQSVLPAPVAGDSNR